MSIVCLTLELIQPPLRTRLACVLYFHVRNGADIYSGAPAWRRDAQRVSGRNQKQIYLRFPQQASLVELLC